MIKNNPPSPNDSLIDNGVQYTEITKNTRVLSAPKVSSLKEANQRFYFRYYLLLSLILSQNLIYFGLETKSYPFLFFSVGTISFLIIFSILSIVFSNRDKTRLLGKIFNKIALLCITGLAQIAIDPNIMNYYIQGGFKSYLSSLQTLILLLSLGYRYSINSIKFTAYVQFLAIISLILSLYIRPDNDKTIYEFLILIIFTLLGALHIKQPNYSTSTKVVPSGPVVSGVEELTRNLDLIITKVTDLNENPDHRASLPFIIDEIKSVHYMLKNSPNIYSAQLNSMLKGMDEQDKIFIEQACFESCSVSNLASPRGEVKKGNIENYGVSELSGVLKSIGKEWNFNTFFINACTNEAPLQVIGAYTITAYGLDQTFNIQESTLNKFLSELEGKYIKNHYHNSIHAADIMCSSLFIIQNSMLFEYISSLEFLASILSALAHDVGHPGKNNKFMVTSKSDVSILYNDISVLEMMHASILFETLKIPNCNILDSFVGETWLTIRRDLIELILATDMGKHFELIGQFKSKYLSTDLYDLTSRETRTDLFKLIIKAADIGHAAKNIDLHELWCSLVIAEFYEQGDLEKSLGLPVSMYCDRDTTDICKSQTGFIKNIVLPLYISLNSVLISQSIEEKCVKQLILNQKYWENQRKFGRGQSVVLSQEEHAKKNSFFPKLKSRKGSLPDKSLA